MRTKILTLLAPLLLAGCSSYSLAPHKIEIQQGNVVTTEMVEKLKPGMTRSQVRFALGSPLIVDAFHADRWDYVYRLEQKGKLVGQSKMAVHFEGDKLTRIEGTPAPASAQPVKPATPTQSSPVQASASPDSAAPVTKQTPAEPAAANGKETNQPKQEKGFFGRMLEKIGL